VRADSRRYGRPVQDNKEARSINSPAGLRIPSSAGDGTGAAEELEQKDRKIRMFRPARHWPKAVIAVGAILTFAWIGTLAWLIARAILAAM